jgi:hypothetical protein
MEPVRQRRVPPASPLLLLVHGRAGGLIPAELIALAHQLELERAAPVALHALSAGGPPADLPLSSSGRPLILVPLLLLPGGHVRQDLPVLNEALKRALPRPLTLRRLPFLGAWPTWQRALAQEAEAVALEAAIAGAQRPQAHVPPRPWLLHHPLESRLGGRFLELLERRCGVDCHPARFEGPGSEAPPSADRPWLPLALATNRLTETLQAHGQGDAARPLLARERLRRPLMNRLRALP